MSSGFPRKAVLGMALVSLLSLSFPAAADIYKYLDPNGRIYLTDQSMGPGYKLLRVFKGMGGTRSQPAAPRFSLPTAARIIENKKRYAPIIEAAAERERLRPELLHAVVLAESAYDPRALSSAGAAGLMQLMPETAKRFGVNDRWDPVANVNAGARYLRVLLDLFEHDLKLALAAYNAGESAVKKYGNRIPPYPETQHYVQKVMAYYRQTTSNS